MPAQGCFVTGTDTGAGKTILAAALCAAIGAAGRRVAAFKPVVTGTDEEPAGGRLAPQAAPAAHDDSARTETATSAQRPHATGTQQPLPTGAQQPLPTGTQQPHATGTQQPHATGTQQPHATGTQQPHATDAQQPHATGTQQPLPTGTQQPVAGGEERSEPRPAGDRDEPPGPTAWPPDHELLATVTGARPGDVTTRTFGPAVSPHLAAELDGTAIALDALVAAAASAAAGADVLVVEGVGGLLVPLSVEHDIRDLAVALGLPVVIAARPGLGTINHSLLTIEAARAAGLDVRAVVLTPWPSEPTRMERSNRDTIARLGRIEVVTLPFVPSVEDLARAGAALPWADWLGGVSS